MLLLVSRFVFVSFRFLKVIGELAGTKPRLDRAARINVATMPRSRGVLTPRCLATDTYTSDG
jgi:hypothetical protein